MCALHISRVRAEQVPTIDCSTGAGQCPEISITGDAPQPFVGFHGYADPSIRKDVHSSKLYMTYSWPNVLSNGTRVIDLHLATSVDNGNTWQYVGPLFTSRKFLNPGGQGNYPLSNQTSSETSNILPVDYNGSTLWIQVHWDYLVAIGGIPAQSQLNVTSYLSVTAALVPPNSPASALLALGQTAAQASLGNAGTDPTLPVTQNLSSLNAAVSYCTQFNETSLFVKNGTLYLAALCVQPPAIGNGSGGAFFVFSTPLQGTDPVRWRWSYVGKMATPVEAAALGRVEGIRYHFFNELDVVQDLAGDLMGILTPAVVSTTGAQLATQYGCRAVPISWVVDPITRNSVPALNLDTSGVPIVKAKVTINDLYTGENQGTGACAYDPASNTGIIIVHKLESDPILGFYVKLLESRVRIPSPPAAPTNLRVNQ